MSGSGSAKSDLARVGRRVLAEGLVSGNFGNASIRQGDVFLVKQSGAFLDDPGPLVRVPLEGEIPAGASRETLVHREIYRLTPHRAILHTHPPHAVALSFDAEKIVPVDAEGMALCPAIPVVKGEPGSPVLGDRLAHALLHGKIAIARGHGTFAGGKNLEEAYLATAAAEHACRVLWLKHTLEKQGRG
jgi:L-fuculose-phosphate aldolase